MDAATIIQKFTSQSCTIPFSLGAMFGRDLPLIIHKYSRLSLTDILVEHYDKLDFRRNIDTDKWTETVYDDIFKTFGYVEWIDTKTNWRFSFNYDDHVYEMLEQTISENSDIRHDETLWFWSNCTILPEEWKPFLVYDFNGCGHTQMLINVCLDSPYYRKILVFTDGEFENTTMHRAVIEAVQKHDLLSRIIITE